MLTCMRAELVYELDVTRKTTGSNVEVDWSTHTQCLSERKILHTAAYFSPIWLICNIIFKIHQQNFCGHTIRMLNHRVAAVKTQLNVDKVHERAETTYGLYHSLFHRTKSGSCLNKELCTRSTIPQGVANIW
jgi:hypothetical protein